MEMRHPGQIYAFGDFRLDAGRRALTPRSGGLAIPLSNPAFEILLCLLRRPGDLVERSSLLAQVWPHVHVVDNSLSQAMAALRRALGDDAAAPRYVATVARRGYRLVADVLAEDRTARDLQAYQLYAVGCAALMRPGGDSLVEARTCFEAAVARDPDFALAHACLAETYSMQCIHGLTPASDAIPRMQAAIGHAMALAPDRSEVQAMSGKVIELAELDYRAASAAYRRALELNPHCYWGQRMLGLHLIHTARSDEAIALFRKCQETQPLAVNLHGHIGMAHYYAGRYPEAIDQLELTLRMDPQFEVSRGFLGRCHLLLGDFERAVAEFTAGPSVVHSRGADLPVVFALSGRHDQARAGLAALMRDEPARPYDIAVVHAALGQDAEAMEWLERAIEARTPGFFAVDPMFARIRPSARFQSIVQRLGLSPD
jgi:eukaryotic-like serine/threonine-protein kinase